MLFTARALLILDLLEEVVAFIIDEDKRRKIFHFDFPDSFHPQFRIGHALEALDTLLGEHCRRAADASKVEAAVFMAGIGHLLAAVAFRQHHHARAVGLQQINVRVHAACGSRPQRAGGVTVRRLGRTCVVDRVIFDVLRQRLAVVDNPLLIYKLESAKIWDAMINEMYDRISILNCTVSFLNQFSY